MEQDAHPEHGSRRRTVAFDGAPAGGNMDDLDDWLDREAGLAALQGVCEGVIGSLTFRKLIFDTV